MAITTQSRPIKEGEMTKEDTKDDLADRVYKFNRLQLPGQPMGMHMGTSYLVNDLWMEVQRLRAALAAKEG